MDDDGLCNPYAVVTLQGFAGHTKVAEPTCHPMWYETVRVEVNLPQPVPISTQILIRVYDQDDAEDTVGGDQLIGKFYVDLLGIDKSFRTRPEWQMIKIDGHEKGELLCSFQLIAIEELAKVPLNDITPPMRSVDVEVNIVGVRELLPYNNAPIVRPYVEIDCGDRSTSDKFAATHPSTTPSGPDANFLQTLTIHTRLPEDLLFCPQLNVRVFEYSKQGSTPVVAKCSIPLAPYCEWIKEAQYLPNNRPRIPTVEIVDEIDEASTDEEDANFDAKYDEARSTIDNNLYEANFCFMPEIKIDTPSIADLKAVRQFNTGRLRGQGVRTLPLTETRVPEKLTECDPEEDTAKEAPLEKELEHEVQDPPFDEWSLLRSAGYGMQSAKREVGRFKARVRIVEADLKSKVGQDWNLSDLFEQSVYITRLYVTRGIKLTPKDSDGLADPFMVVRNGKHKQNIFDDIEHYQRDTLNPNFYRVFELPTMVPGNPTLTIEVWDKDANGRQLIGTTTIDIENRLFSQEWLEMSPKPVERRYLWTPASLAPQGKLEMWLEILTPAQALAVKARELKPPARLECQLRVVVYAVVELEYRGKSPAIEADEATNAFVTIQAGNGPTFESDVHNGARDTAEFNWRYVFDVEQPTRYTKLSVQIWDTRLTSANESLAECTLQLQKLYNNVRRAPSREHVVPRDFYKCTHPFYPGQQAKIEMEIRMMTREVAERSENLAGVGRGAPNNAPFLPPPNRQGAQLARRRSQAFSRASSIAKVAGFGKLRSTVVDAVETTSAVTTGSLLTLAGRETSSTELASEGSAAPVLAAQPTGGAAPSRESKSESKSRLRGAFGRSRDSGAAEGGASADLS